MIPAVRRWLLLPMIVGGCGLPPSPPPTNPVRILHLNDVYVADTLADGTGGLARVAGIARRLSGEGPTLFVLAGDFLSPTLGSKYFHGRQMVDVLNAAGVDYVTFGNHEFELGQDTLTARIAESQFKWISANCTTSTGAAFPGVTAWDTVRLNGRLVGLFGLTMPGDYRSSVRCSNPDSAAAQAIDTLDALGAQFIIAVTHQPVAADRSLLNRETRLDLILGGHEHSAMDETVGGRHLLKADANARSAQFVTIWGSENAWRQAVTLIRIDDREPADSAVASRVRQWSDSLRHKLGPPRVVGEVIAPIDARDVTSRRSETAIGDLVTDAMRAGTGADVALLNAGTLRLDDVIAIGPLSTYTLESLFLFADEARVVTFPLTGGRLRELLEHGVSASSVGTGAYVQVSGVTFTYDAGGIEGHRIQGDLRRPDGSVIHPGDNLTVAFDVYPACTGGDGYAVPEAAAPCRTWEDAPRAADLLIRYVERELGGRVAPPADGRVKLNGS